MKKVFKWFTIPNERLALVQVAWFVEHFSIDDFKGVDRMLYLFLKYCADLDIPALRHYLEAFLQTDGKKLIKKYKIKLDTMELFNYDEPASLEEAYRIISSSVFDEYDDYIQDDLDNRTFKVDMQMFMTEQKTERTQLVLAEAFPKLSNGDDVDVAIDEMQDSLERIKEVYDLRHLAKLDFMSGNAMTDHGVTKQRLLFKTGLPCIDGDIGGMYSKMVWSFTASPGAGKTRLSVANFAYRAAVVEKLDVLYKELELTKMEVQNMLIAHHILHLYNGKIKIPDSDMNKGNLSPEQQRYYEAAKMDLFESGKYGNIVIDTDDLVVERFQKETYSFLRHNKNTQLIVIDYAGLAKSKPVEKYARSLEQYQVISELYKNAKDIAKTADIGILILNQFNEKGIAAAQQGKRVLPGYVQGGQAISQHADYDVAMTMTEEQELAGMAMMSTVKKRAAKGFQNVPYSKDLSISLFRQIKQQATN